MSNYHRWGTTDHLWGDSGRLWGDPIDPATDPILYWMIEIDWANSGTYTGENEAKYCIDMETNAGRTNRLNIDSNGNADGIKMPSVGTARIVLDNTTRRFDPYYTSGALYGNILPGRYIKIRVTYQGVIYPIFHGNIKNIKTQSGENPTTTLECEDGMRFIQQADVNISLSQNVYMRNAVYQLLQDIDWPSRFGTDLTGVEAPTDYPSNWQEQVYVMPFFSANGAARERLKELVDAYAGQFWVDESGSAHFEHFIRYTTTSAFTIQENNTIKNIQVPMPWENIINVFKFYYYPRARQATGTIWQSADNTSLIENGQDIEIWGEYTFNNEACAALGVIAPVATTDFTMNTASDGSGTDLTADFTVAITDFGNSAKLVVTNNSASSDGYITLLKIRGDAIANTGTSYYYSEDVGSIALYGRKALTIKSPYSQSYESIAVHDANFYALATDEVLLEVDIEGRPDIQFSAMLFDTIDALFPIFGWYQDPSHPTVPTTKRIGHKSIKWLSENGQLVRTTFILEDDR